MTVLRAKEDKTGQVPRMVCGIWCALSVSDLL